MIKWFASGPNQFASNESVPSALSPVAAHACGAAPDRFARFPAPPALPLCFGVSPRMMTSDSYRPVVALLCGLVLLSFPANGEEPRLAVPVFKDGEAQVVESFNDPDRWLRHDLWVETEFDSDGDGKLDRMHVDVTRPRQTDSEGLKLPVVYISSPYFCGVGSSDEAYFWNVRHELGAEPPPRKAMPEIELKIERPIISKSHLNEWVPRGYVVVHSSAPGTGLSEGCPTLGGDNESLAPKAVVDWLCGRAPGFTTPDGDKPVTAYWSTGKVGMTGTSYNGTIPLAAATTGVEGLEAIIPIAPNTSYYHYYRSNGLVRHPGGYLGEDVDYLYDFIHSGNAARRDFCDCEVRDKEMAEGMDRVKGDYNDFWARRDYLNDLAPLKAAVLMAHGFNDWNVTPEHSNRIYQAVKAKGIPSQTYYHQDGHGGPPPMKMMNRWFTRYLHGVQNGVENDPRAWIVREDAKHDEPTAYDDYPNPMASPVVLHLTSGAPQQGTLVTTAVPGQGNETLVDNFSFSGESLAQAEWTQHRLLYVSETLQEPLHVSGTATIEIKLASSKPAVNLSVWLVSLPWNDDEKAKITDNIITRGWADPQNHRSMTASEPLQPGRFYDVTFDLQPDDQIIAKGQQIGLMILSSDRDVTLRPTPGTELTVDVDATRLSLPVVGGVRAFEKATQTRAPKAND
ncbi:Xaa-Pro dipeptidyl-peptidase [Novipirellula galeiformis]|uniref:Xaa-Pro dipeptidyl-peptidase n=2 Tax=Novipirellula galeiformis TaxID=2528004 RepID=A0A5C6C910_9BACT|nr:Xaa-Pro dipeptidyl-peptidase [Novipirellula galeiformis]